MQKIDKKVIQKGISGESRVCKRIDSSI